jgi:hypothetical protein
VRAVPISRRIAAVLVAALLSFPAAAVGQTQTQPLPKDPGSSKPPVDLNGGNTQGGDTGTSGGTPSSDLPNPGSDPRMLFLAGAALTLLGVGLRLRTADADLY